VLFSSGEKNGERNRLHLKPYNNITSMQFSLQDKHLFEFNNLFPMMGKISEKWWEGQTSICLFHIQETMPKLHLAQDGICCTKALGTIQAGISPLPSNYLLLKNNSAQQSV
jgi:hypothetical protein